MWRCFCWSVLYSASTALSSIETRRVSHCRAALSHGRRSELHWVTNSFSVIARQFLNIRRSQLHLQRCLVVTWLVPRDWLNTIQLRTVSKNSIYLCQCQSTALLQQWQVKDYHTEVTPVWLPHSAEPSTGQMLPVQVSLENPEHPSRPWCSPFWTNQQHSLSESMSLSLRWSYGFAFLSLSGRYSKSGGDYCWSKFHRPCRESPKQRCKTRS